MSEKGWNKVEFQSFENILKDKERAWHQGFFIFNNDKNTWKRNYNELKERDIALFTLGDLKDKAVLDIGCGAAMYVLTFLKMGAKHVAGIDIVEELLEDGKNYIKKQGFEADLRIADCTALPHTSNSFDIVFTGDVFEHITHEQKEACIAEVFRVLKAGGIFTIKTPNLNYLKWSLFLKRVKAVLKFQNPFKIYIAHTRNNPDNEHLGLTTYGELRQLLINNCFHEPTITYLKLERHGIPEWLAKQMQKVSFFNDTIIITARKSIFLGLYP